MTTGQNNTPDNKPEKQSTKNKSTIARWIIGGFFTMLALINGFHYSSLFLLGAAFLMFPFDFVKSFLDKQDVKVRTAIILSIALFFLGMVTSTQSESTDYPSNDTTQVAADTADKENDDSTKLDSTPFSDTTVAEPDSTSSEDTTAAEPDSTPSKDTTVAVPDSNFSGDEEVTMVWVASSGTKYHSDPSCSNMKSPKQLSLEDAQNRKYTPCKKCY